MDLAKMALFQELSPGDLKPLEAIAHERPFEKGDILFSEGESPESLWFIQEGEVKVYKEYSSGKSAILGLYSAGDSVALVAVIDSKPYPASCQAMSSGTAVVMRRQDALKVITGNPTIALEVMMDLCGRLRQLTASLGSMSVQSVIRRLSRFLLLMADQMGTKKGNVIHVDLFLTRKELAESIGTSFEVAVRALGKLKEEDILEIKGRKLEIYDRAKLEKMADSD